MELYRLQTGAEAVSARNAVYRDFQSHSTFRTLVGVDGIVSWELNCINSDTGAESGTFRIRPTNPGIVTSSWSQPYLLLA